MTISTFNYGAMTITIDSGEGLNECVVMSCPTLNQESLKFLAETPEAMKILTSDPIHLEVLEDQATFDFWRRLCENSHYALNSRIPVKHFTPAMLKWYMERQVARQGRKERNISRHGSYHVAGKSLICPCPELIELCSNNEIVVKPCFCDPQSLKAIRRSLRSTTMDDLALIWNELGVPLKKTSSIRTGNVHKAEAGGKMFVTYIPDDVPRITLMLFFAKIYGYENAVKPGVKNPLSHEDKQKVSGLTKADKKLATKVSKADLKLMNRGRKKKKKTRKVKPPARSNCNRKQREMNRKFELLRLKRAMGLEKTVV